MLPSGREENWGKEKGKKILITDFFFSGVSGKLNEMSYFYGSIEWEESFKVLSYIFFFSIVFRGIERGYFGISPDSVYQFSWGFVSVSSFFSLWFSLNIWCDSMNSFIFCFLYMSFWSEISFKCLIKLLGLFKTTALYGSQKLYA